MQRAIYCSYQSYTFEAAKLLMKNQIVEPVYWMVNDNVKKQILKNFPSVVIHHYLDATKGKFAESNRLYIPESIDPVFLENNSYGETLILNMLERNDSLFGVFLYKERLEFYYRMIRYWSGVIKSLDVSVVIFEEEPHQASDYILYLVAKSMNISTIIPVRTMSEFGFIITNTLDDAGQWLREPYEKLLSSDIDEFVDISISAKKYLTAVQGTFNDAKKVHLWDQLDSLECSENQLRDQIYSLVKKIKVLVYKVPKIVKLIRYFETDQKVPGKKFENSELSYFRFWFKKQTVIRKKKKNYRIYEGMAQSQIYANENYILFALQYQPEKSTCPMGGYFVNQYLAVELIADMIPDDWSVVVKEHPSQFVTDYTRYGDRYRDRAYYHRLKEIPKVKLVSMSLDTYQLVDKSKAVASVGGTICWEAVHRKVPALSFGEAWYSPCSGIYRVKTRDDIAQAIEKVKKNIAIDEIKIEKFIRVLDAHTFKGAIGGLSQLEHYGITVEENGKIHSSAIKELL